MTNCEERIKELLKQALTIGGRTVHIVNGIFNNKTRISIIDKNDKTLASIELKQGDENIINEIVNNCNLSLDDKASPRKQQSSIDKIGDSDFVFDADINLFLGIISTEMDIKIHAVYNRSLNDKEVQEVKENYTDGKRIMLTTDIFDPYSKLSKGDRGTIKHVDDEGTIFVNWDNGEHTGLLPQMDNFEIIGA